MCLCVGTGEVITCGDNAAGQLGYPKTASTPDHMTYSDRAPQIVLALQDLEVTKVTCGDLYCIANCKGKNGSGTSIGVVETFKEKTLLEPASEPLIVSVPYRDCLL